MDQFEGTSCPCSTCELLVNQKRILDLLAAIESLLKRNLQELAGGKTKSSPEQVRSPSSLVNTKEAADALGLRPATLRSWMGQRRIEVVRLGRSVRIPISEIERLIDEGRIPRLRQ
jgi:excisionase family DNA binding protein